MVQYKLKQRGFYYFNSIPALAFLCVSVKSCWCERREEAVSTLLLEEIRLMSEKRKKKKTESSIDFFEMTVGELVIEAAEPITVTRKDTHAHIHWNIFALQHTTQKLIKMKN